MNKREISEIKKTMSPQECNISRIRGCCVNGEKEILSTFGDVFLSLPEEEVFKYFEIFKKTLSGKIGKAVHNLDIPLSAEKEGGEQAFLLKLRDSELKDDTLVDECFQKIIESYDFAGNFVILLAYGAYDVPGKAEDNETMFDASDDVYRYLLCSICPMELDKPGLTYNEKIRIIENRDRLWNVEMPAHGFLFPAFTDRATDLHAALCYTKKTTDKQANYFNSMFGAELPVSADEQKEMFDTVFEQAFGNNADFDFVKSVNENLAIAVEEKEESEEKKISKEELHDILEKSGAEEEALQVFDRAFDETVGMSTEFDPENLTNASKLDIKVDGVSVSAKIDDGASIETKIINGVKCLVIPISGECSINGVKITN